MFVILNLFGNSLGMLLVIPTILTVLISINWFVSIDYLCFMSTVNRKKAYIKQATKNILENSYDIYQVFVNLNILSFLISFFILMSLFLLEMEYIKEISTSEIVFVVLYLVCLAFISYFFTNYKSIRTEINANTLVRYFNYKVLTANYTKSTAKTISYLHSKIYCGEVNSYESLDFQHLLKILCYLVLDNKDNKIKSSFIAEFLLEKETTEDVAKLINIVNNDDLYNYILFDIGYLDIASFVSRFTAKIYKLEDELKTVEKGFKNFKDSEKSKSLKDIIDYKYV